MKNKALHLLAAIITILLPSLLLAGGITGKIIDSSSGEPVFGATIIVREIKAVTRTDSEGNYRLELPAGTHNVEYIMYGFDTQKKSVNIGEQFTKHNLVFGLKSLETVEVIDKARKNSEAGLLAAQKKSASVSDGITAESISKSPDSSAGDVLRRVTGITLIEGKYVFVRGLGEKYSNTLLNDVMIPSTEPDKRVIPLDIFPASVLKNITVDKTFLPENPGEFAGGLVKVSTKEYPDQFEMKAGFGIGENSFTTGRSFKSMKEYKGDKYGSMSPEREPFPVSSYPDELKYQGGNISGGLPPAAITLGTLSMDNQWTPETKKAPYDKKANFSVGDTIRFSNGMRFGYLYGTSYSRKYRTTDRIEARYAAVNPVQAELDSLSYLTPLQAQTLKKYNEAVTWGNNLNLAVEPKKGQEFYVKLLRSNQSDKYFQEAYGYNNLHEIGIISDASGFIARELTNITAGGNHLINPTQNWRNHMLKWHYSNSTAIRNEPDQKQQFWNLQPGSSTPTRFGGSPDGNRFFSTTTENMTTWDLKYELPFKQWLGLESKLKFGLLHMETQKDFGSKTFNYQRTAAQSDADIWPVPGELTFSPIRIYNDELNFYQNAASPNSYTGQQTIDAKFIQTDMPITTKLRFIGGVRQEESFQKTKTYNPTDLNNIATYMTSGCEDVDTLTRELLVSRNVCPANNYGIGSIKTNDNLPSVNFVYAWDKKTNLRAAYSETVTRPDLRDLSPFGFSAYYGADTVFGNTELDRTYIHNYDLRWEKYLTPTEYAGVGIFYKNLSAPIEIVGLPVGGDVAFNYININAEKAVIKGVELDARKDFLGKWRIEGNLFFIQSNVDVMTWEDYALTELGFVNPTSLKAVYSPTNISRPLQGQSENVMNIKLSYFLDKEKTSSVSLYYNYFSDRIQIVGTAGAPDVIEKRTGVYDLVFAKTYKKKYDFKIKAKNINNVTFKSYQESKLLGTKNVYKSYKPGPSLDFSMAYKF